MKEGTKIEDHLFNVFNTLTCQLDSMDVKLEDEDKAITVLFSFPEYLDHFVTCIKFSTTETLDFNTIVGALLFKEEQRK